MVADDLLPDSQAETRPDAPAPLASHAGTHAARVERLIDRLAGRPGALAPVLIRKLRQLATEFWSWTRCPPTADVRERKLAALDALDAQAMAALLGDR